MRCHALTSPHQRTKRLAESRHLKCQNACKSVSGYLWGRLGRCLLRAIEPVATHQVHFQLNAHQIKRSRVRAVGTVLGNRFGKYVAVLGQRCKQGHARPKFEIIRRTENIMGALPLDHVNLLACKQFLQKLYSPKKQVQGK